MEKNKKKPKAKIFYKTLTFIVMIIVLISVSVFPTFANSVNERVDVEYLCGGSPINMSYVTIKRENSTYLTYTGYAPSVNQYVIDTNSATPAPSYYYGISGSTDFGINYRVAENIIANQTINFTQPTIAPQWASHTPCVVRNYGDINQKGYNLILGIYQPHSIHDEDWTPYVYAETVNVRHVYNITYHEILEDGTVVPKYTNIYKDIQYDVASDGWARIRLYAPEVFDSDFFERYSSFIYEGETYACINSATILLMEGDNPVLEGVYSMEYYIEPILDRMDSISLVDYQRRYREDLSIIGNNDRVNVQFNDVSFTEWIKKSVGGFMDFEIVPGITFAGILAVMIGLPLLIWFLKLFAGG